MWPVLVNIARSYAPYIVWPAAAVIGVIGYNIEKVVRGDGIHTPAKEKSIMEEREERLLKENEQKDLTNIDSLKDKTFVPRTISERFQSRAN